MCIRDRIVMIFYDTYTKKKLFHCRYLTIERFLRVSNALLLIFLLRHWVLHFQNVVEGNRPLVNLFTSSYVGFGVMRSSAFDTLKKRSIVK